MSMTLAEIRLKQNPILSGLLLGMKPGKRIAEKLFPRLPQVLSSVNLVQMGKEHMRRYNLRRAPGSETKSINIKFEGKVYTVDQYSVDIPMPRELLREADESRKLNVGNYLQISTIAMNTADYVLSLDYELEVAGMATNVASYNGNHLALAGATKWSAPTGTPVTDVRTAAEMIRRKCGVRPNKLIFSADAFFATTMNPEVKSYLPTATTLGPATLEQMKTVFNVAEIEVGDAIWVDENDVGQDVWGNSAILAYVPNIGGGATSDFNLAEPAFGFTNVIEGHPFAETPYYKDTHKSWVYGATFERRPNIAYADAGFLFVNPK